VLNEVFFFELKWQKLFSISFLFPVAFGVKDQHFSLILACHIMLRSDKNLLLQGALAIFRFDSFKGWWLGVCLILKFGFWAVLGLFKVFEIRKSLIKE
jgi:hypothetical protein